MAHSNNIISKIKLPNDITYDLHDTEAVHKVSSTDNAVVRFDGSSGDIQNSLVTISDTGAITIGGTWTATSADNPFLQMGNSSTTSQNARLTANNTGAFTFAPCCTPTFLANTTEFRPLSGKANQVDLGSAQYGFRTVYAGTSFVLKNGTITKSTTNAYTYTLPEKSGTIALTNDIPTITFGKLITDNATALSPVGSSGESFDGTINLHKISKTGSYADLLNKPIIDNTPTLDSTNLVSSGGVFDAIQDVLEIAEGKTSTYVVTTSTESRFNTQSNVLVLGSSFVDLSGNIIALTDLKIGDVIYILEDNIPDRWVGIVDLEHSSVICYKLETAKVPVTDVQTKATAAGSYTSVLTNTVAQIDLSNFVLSSSLATVATSGSYNDLTNKPTIPTNSDYVDLTTSQTINGTKTFTSRPQSSITYTQIEYLQSNYSGSGAYPYIRTGVKRGVHWTNKLTTILDGYFTISQAKGFCGYDSGGQIGQSNGKWSTEAGISTVACVGVANRATVKQEINISTGKDTLYINDTQIAQRSVSSASSYASTFDYPLFVASGGSSAAYSPAALVMYSFKMYDDSNTLIRDFVPVKDHHGTLGLLDQVTGEFYTNLGTGTFSAGAEGQSVTSISSLLTSEDVGMAALTNNYGDLDNKPTIPTVGTIITTNSTTQTPATESLGTTINLHKVSKTGSYNDLLDKPTIPVIPEIPTVGNLTTTSSQYIQPQENESFSGSISLHRVSKTGSYTDLINQPDIPTKTSDLTNDGDDGTHAFVDTEDVYYTNTNGTTMAVGGIPKGTTFTNKSLMDIIEDMLYPYVQFSFSSIATTTASGTFEYGTSKIITKVTPTFTKGSKNISSVKIGTTSGASDLYSGASAMSGTAITISTVNLNGLSNYTVYCTLSDGVNSTTKSTTFTFSKYIYYGVKSSTTAPTSSSGLTGVSGVSNGVSITTTNNSYIWFLCPTAKTKIQEFAMNQWNDVSTTSAGTVTFTTATNQQLTYYAYRSDKMVAATSTYKIV